MKAEQLRAQENRRNISDEQREKQRDRARKRRPCCFNRLRATCKSEDTTYLKNSRSSVRARNNTTHQWIVHHYTFSREIHRVFYRFNRLCTQYRTRDMNFTFAMKPQIHALFAVPVGSRRHLQFLCVSAHCIDYAAVDQLESSEQNSMQYHPEREENYRNSINSRSRFLPTVFTMFRYFLDPQLRIIL